MTESESEPELEQISELEFKLKPKFEESMGTKMRRQKSDEESQKGQGLQILNPDQMLRNYEFL